MLVFKGRHDDAVADTTKAITKYSVTILLFAKTAIIYVAELLQL